MDDDRYDSSEGWDGSNNRRRRRRKKSKPLFTDMGRNPFELSKGDNAGRPKAAKPAGQLFGSLWREGELAVLFGETGTGKSILAVQIAESIARRSADALVRNGRGFRGRTDPQSPNPFHSNVKPQKVLYIDFERTRRQFDERYSAPHPLPGKLPVRHRFSRNLMPRHLGDIDYIPDIFKGDVHRFIQYWLLETIETSGARVVVIDNISYLARSLTNTASAASVMKTLRLWATRFDLSILVTAHARKASPPVLGGVAAALGGRGGRRPRPLLLADLAAASPIADLADTVFAIAPSTVAPDLRYIKHLKSRNSTLEHNEHNVITCQLTREAILSRSPVSLSLVSQSPASPTPFLRFNYLGSSTETDHLRDYAREALLSNPRSEIPNPKSNRGVVNMLMSREYWKYMNR